MAAPLRVLVVEDSEDDCLLLVRQFQQSGIEPFWKRIDDRGSLGTALAEDAWDVILCDFNLPEFNAFQVLEDVAKAGLDIPLIIVSGSIGEEKAADVFRAGACDLVFKNRLARLVPAVLRETEQAAIREKQRELKASIALVQERYRALVEDQPELICTCLRDFRLTYVNRAFAEHLGRAPESLLGRFFIDVLSPAARAKFLEYISSFTPEDPVKRKVLQSSREDDEPRWHLWAHRAFFDSNGTLTHFHCIGSDITELKRTEEALAQSEQRFRTLTDGSSQGILVHASDRPLYANEALARMFGYRTADEILALDSAALLEDPEERERMKLFHEARLQGKPAPTDYEFKGTKKDGSRIWLNNRAFRIRWDGGWAVCKTLFDITERKRAAEKLRESEKRFRDIAEASSDWFWEMDESLRFTFFSERMQEVTGLSLDETLGKTRWELAGGDPETDETWRTHREVLEAGQPFRDFQYVYTDRRGQKRYWNVNGVPIFDKDGTFKGYRGSATDITLHKESENALRESRQTLYAIIDSLPALINAKDVKRRYTVVNKFQAGLFGVCPRTAIGKTAGQLLNGEAAEQMESFDQKVFDRGEAVRNHELEFEDREGIRRTFLSTKVPLKNEAGTITNVVTVALEVTDLKKAERAARERRDRLDGIMANIDDVIITIREDGIIETVNPAAGRMFGYSADELLGQNVSMLMPEPHRERHDGYVRNYLSTGESKILGKGLRDVTGLRKDGSTVPLELSISEMRLARGRVFIGVLRDITDRLKIEYRLRQADKMDSLGNLAGGIAHDLNNRLLPIMALTGMTLEEFAEGSKQRERLEKVLYAAEGAKDLVARILAYSRQDDGERKELDICLLVRDALTLLRSTLPSTITIKEDIDPNTGLVLADRMQIEMVLMNLASNAADAMGGKPGELEIRLSREEVAKDAAISVSGIKAGSYARLAVRDTGCGMDEKTMERIFDPFFTTKDVGEGTGLGLAVAQGILTKHEGALNVSSALGRGTTVEVYLPVISKRQEEIKKTESTDWAAIEPQGGGGIPVSLTKRTMEESGDDPNPDH